MNAVSDSFDVGTNRKKIEFEMLGILSLYEMVRSRRRKYAQETSMAHARASRWPTKLNDNINTRSSPEPGSDSRKFTLARAVNRGSDYLLAEAMECRSRVGINVMEG
jgi:hypothetical protein